MKQTGFYFIIIGTAVFVIAFISKIIKFLADNPVLGLALIAIIVGILMLLYGIYVESSEDKDKEPFRGIKK